MGLLYHGGRASECYTGAVHNGCIFRSLTVDGMLEWIHVFATVCIDLQS